MVPKLLMKLARMGIKLGIITNGPVEHQSNKIKSLRLTQYISKELSYRMR
ncbi:HAD hydrolase-like protein [Anoxybacillus caldiproteolyticus]|nr:HAD hydrolase-like protein [Anoxybacillus caldiproteolyticus]